MQFIGKMEVRPENPNSIRSDLYFQNGELVANCGTDREVASEIVRRWNAHADLLAALEECEPIARKNGYLRIADAARAAIARARGEEGGAS